MNNMIKKLTKLLTIFTFLFFALMPPTNFDRGMKVAKAAGVTLSSPTQSGTQITLNWTNDPTATGYHIYRTTNHGSVRLTGTIPLSAGTTTYIDTNNIEDHEMYQYEVAALINGEEVFSNAQSIYSKISPEVGSLSASPSSHYVDLTFTQSPSTDVKYFEIYRGGALIGVTTDSNYRDVGVNASTSYTYFIKAVDIDELKSTASNSVSVNTGTAPLTNQTIVYSSTIDDFGAKWTATGTNPTSLSLGIEAKWNVTGRNVTRQANADLINNFIIQPSEAGGSAAQVSFTWKKSWGNDRAQGEYLYLYIDYLKDGVWTTGVWSDLTKPAVNGTSTGSPTVNLSNLAGNYKLRFRADIRTSDRSSSDFAWITVDNVQISKTISNTAPSAPTNVMADIVNTNQVNLSWQPPADTDLIGYQIFRKLSTDASYPVTALATTKTNMFIDATAEPNTNYSYKIQSIDSGNLKSSISGTNETTIAIPPVSSNGDQSAPNPASNLRLSHIGSASVELSWDASNASDLAEYLLLRSTDGVNYSVVETVTSLTTINKQLLADTTYYYRIIAIDTGGNPSSPTNLLKIKTNPPDTQAPSEPSGFSVEILGETYIKFIWNPSVDNDKVDRYEIDIFDGTWKKIKQFPFPATTGTIEGLLPGTTYQFRIKAVDASNNVSNSVLLSPEGTVTTKVDLSPPKLIFKKPASQSVEVGTKEYILVRFDDIINKTTVNINTLKVLYYPPTASLTMAAAEQVSGTYIFYPETNPTEVKFSPTTPLETNTSYEVQVAGVENISGTAIEPTAWTFTTGITEYTKPHGNYNDTTTYCKYCHNAHSGQQPRLLNKQGVVHDVCFSCHDGTGSSLNIKDQFLSSGVAKNSHHPIFSPSGEEQVKISCITCHNPHDGGKDLDTGAQIKLPRLLNVFNKGNPTGTPAVAPLAVSTGSDVCFSCHGKEGATRYSNGYIDGGEIINPPQSSGPAYAYRTDHESYFPTNGKGHSSTVMDNKKGSAESASGTNIKCVACHEKHGSDVKPLLRKNIDPTSVDPTTVKNGKEFCYQCHTGALNYANSDNTETSSNNYDGKDVNEGRGHAQFDCQVCHNPHGSPYPNYLRLNYRVDTTSQRSFNNVDAELCFDCHDRSKLLSMGAAIRGRQDRGNYHSFHINGQSATCKNCHRPHGAISSENGSGINHRIGFPSSRVGGSRRYNRDAQADDSLPGGSGSCSLNCHGRDHSDYNYDGAFRDGSGISGFNANNAYMLKDNWKTNSVLLNTRPDGTGVYDFGTYKIDYRNGANGTSHFRDAGTTPNDGFHWK